MMKTFLSSRAILKEMLSVLSYRFIHCSCCFQWFCVGNLLTSQFQISIFPEESSQTEKGETRPTRGVQYTPLQNRCNCGIFPRSSRLPEAHPAINWDQSLRLDRPQPLVCLFCASGGTASGDPEDFGLQPPGPPRPFFPAGDAVASDKNFAPPRLPPFDPCGKVGKGRARNGAARRGFGCKRRVEAGSVAGGVIERPGRRALLGPGRRTSAFRFPLPSGRREAGIGRRPARQPGRGRGLHTRCWICCGSFTVGIAARF